MTEEKRAEEKIHLALSRLNRINTFSERFSLFGQSTVNAIREKTSQAWFSVKRLFIKTPVLGSVPVPDLPEIADETNVVIPQKVTDSAVIDSGLNDDLTDTDDAALLETVVSDAVTMPCQEIVVSATFPEVVVSDAVTMPKPVPEITTDEETKEISSMETVD